jgi:hypothetical protein
VSDVLVERLGVPPNRGLPADVTVKTDNEDTSKVLVIGHPEHVEAVTNVIYKRVPATIVIAPPFGLYATFVVRVRGLKEGKCYVDTPYGIAELAEFRECREGALMPASVIKVPTQPRSHAVLVPGARVVGDYAVVWRGSKVLFSPHIRNKDRVSELLNLSMQYVRRGVSIKWRSNADEAPLTAILSELPKLVEQLEKVESKVQELDRVAAVSAGERIVFIHLTYDAKTYLDQVRREVTATTKYHHMIKSARGLYRDIAELLDEFSTDVSEERMGEIVRKFVSRVVKEVGEITIGHRKIDGSYIKLGPAKVINVGHEGRLELELVRRVKSPGVYDGLGVRKDAGDLAKTLIIEGRPFVVHQYYTSNGDLKGVYVSFGTKPEVVLPDTVEYVDLAVDLVRASGGSCELVDQDELRSYLTGGYVRLSQEIVGYLVSGIGLAINTYCSSG